MASRQHKHATKRGHHLLIGANRSRARGRRLQQRFERRPLCFQGKPPGCRGGQLFAGAELAWYRGGQPMAPLLVNPVSNKIAIATIL
jgi:hypothetical protein